VNRPRSNALTGTSDARYRSPAEIELYAAMQGPVAVAPELDDFLKRVFASKDVMERLTSPDDIADGIYNLYSESGAGGSRMSAKAVLQAARANWGTFAKTVPLKVQKDAFFQYTMVPGKGQDGEDTEVNLMLTDPRLFSDDGLAMEAAQDFLYFPLNAGRAGCRVYLNVTFDSMPAVVKAVLELPDGNAGKVVDVKTTGPGSSRADSVVIYVKTIDDAKVIAPVLLAAISKGTLRSTDQTTPAMTTRVGPAVAIGAEPKPQETGLGRPLPSGYPRGAQSFGSVRSQVICAAVLNYRENTGVLGSGYEVFKKLAAIGFKGYGLDPAAPGN